MICLHPVNGTDANQSRRRHRHRRTASITSRLMIVLTLIFITCNTGCALFMLTRGQQMVVEVNDTVVIDCHFQETTDDQFNLFDNPVHWSKSQLDEHSQVNMMVNLVEPFSQVDQGRLRVSFAGTSPNYTMTLVIAHILQEDTANYTCIVSGPHNVILASVTHLIQVRAEMQQLKLIHNDVNDGVQRVLVSTTPGRRASSLGQLVVRDGDAVAVDCVAVGGCPPPSAILRLGLRDVTDLFTTSVDPSLSGKRRSMRRVHYVVVKRHRALTATTAYDGLTLRCLATVPGFGPLSVGLRLTVLYGPIITCTDVTATPGDSDVILLCNVIARPQVTSLYWTISNETAISDVTLGSNYVTVVRDMGGFNAQLESQLLIRHVTTDSFRTFTIVAENEVSTALRDVRLLTREIHPLPSRDKSSTSAKFGRDSSSRYHQPAAGHDSVASGVALYRYVTSSDQTTPVGHVTSSTTECHHLSALTAMVMLILLLHTMACHHLFTR